MKWIGCREVDEFRGGRGELAKQIVQATVQLWLLYFTTMFIHVGEEYVPKISLIEQHLGTWPQLPPQMWNVMK
jgi:hypothetical protein